MNDKELPLLSWRPPSAAVIAFPARALRAQAKRRAAVIATYRREEAVRGELTRVANTHRERLMRAGVPEGIADREAATLRELVVSELHRLWHAPRSSDHGEDAG